VSEKREVGVVSGGDFQGIIIRKDSDRNLEMGQLLVYEEGKRNIIIKVYNLLYGSTLPQPVIDTAQGYVREGSGPELSMYEEDEKVAYFLRGVAKPLLEVVGEAGQWRISLPKSLPAWWTGVREATEADFGFLRQEGTFMGKLRSGSKVLQKDVMLPTEALLTHHVLVAASTGKGKSNLVKVMLYSIGKEGSAGALLIDPHGEYWGIHGRGLRLLGDKAVLFSSSRNLPAGAYRLTVGLGSLVPDHFSGVLELTEPQQEGLEALYKAFGANWLIKLFKEEASWSNLKDVREATLKVLRRKLSLLLRPEEGDVFVYSGEDVVSRMCDLIDQAKIVVLDTSTLGEGAELLLANVVAYEVLKRHRFAMHKGNLDDLPPVAVVIEEAARVLGEGVEPNVIETVAREGRKFKVGILAVTQLPSLIQKELMANMNTKVIMGNEALSERQALVNSSPQDLAGEEAEIASLDVGEAIISSSFMKMAIPVKVPLFDDFVAATGDFRPTTFAGRPKRLKPNPRGTCPLETVQFLHAADAHLGSQDRIFMKKGELQALHDMISTAIGERVDFVAFCGDFFDSNVPPLSVAREAAKELRRLLDAGIPFYEIHGSHDNSPTHSSMVEVLEDAGLMRQVYAPVSQEGTLRLNPVQGPKGVRLFGMPGLREGREKEYYEALDRDFLERQEGLKVFLFHGAVEGMAGVSTMDFVPISLFPKGFSYYAGGHIHQRQKRDVEGYGTFAYPGPLFAGWGIEDLRRYREVGGGFYLVSLGKSVEVQEVTERPVDVVFVEGNADGKTPAELMGNLEPRGDFSGKVVVIVLKGTLSSGRVSDISFPYLRDSYTKAGALDVMFSRGDLKGPSSLVSPELVQAGSMSELEAEILKKAKSPLEPSLLKSLFDALSQTQLEGETKSDYTKRVLAETEDILRRHLDHLDKGESKAAAAQGRAEEHKESRLDFS